MSKNRKDKAPKKDVEKQSEYYRLKTKAVEDLVGANEENSPQVSPEELRAYRSGPKIKVADWAKMLFIKGWFAGAVCFFFMWGLGGFLTNELDILFITGMALGVVTEWLTNPVLRFFEKTKGENDRWMMVHRRGTAGLLLNVLYGYVILILVYIIYNAINAFLNFLMGTTGVVVLGVEPVLFGVFSLCVDLLLLWIRSKFVANAQ